MWFNYVLLYTLHVNEENGVFFFVLHATMVLGKGKILGGWGSGVGGDAAGNLWAALTKPYGLHFPKQDTGDQSTEKPSALFCVWQALLCCRWKLSSMVWNRDTAVKWL